jgi:ribosomal-protein-alanine N-acetyltransferase
VPTAFRFSAGLYGDTLGRHVYLTDELKSMTARQPLSMEPMKPSDLEDVLFIERASFSRPWTRDMYQREMQNRTSRTVVFRADGQLAGYMCFWEVLDEAHLMTIAVRPERRGEGFGKAMMDQLETICWREGVKRIVLEVGRRNTSARSLYKKCGYTPIGFRKRYYKEIQDDALVMEKRLDPTQYESSEANDGEGG